MTTEELAKKMELSGRSELSIYWNTRNCLFDKGIIVNSKRDHELTLLMRARTRKDKLPASKR